MLPLAGYHSGIMKGKLPGKKGTHLFSGEGGEIPCQLFGLSFVGAHKGYAPPRLLMQGCGKMGPVDARQPCHRRRTASIVHRGKQTLKFRNSPKYIGQQLHSPPSF